MNSRRSIKDHSYLSLFYILKDVSFFLKNLADGIHTKTVSVEIPGGSFKRLYKINLLLMVVKLQLNNCLVIQVELRIVLENTEIFLFVCFIFFGVKWSQAALVSS